MTATIAKRKLGQREVPPSVECHSKPSSSDNSTDTRVCYSTPVYAAVLNESSGKVWGIKLSHSHQGERPELMERTDLDPMSILNLSMMRFVADMNIPTA